jgi:hypothetical protein
MVQETEGRRIQAKQLGVVSRINGVYDNNPDYEQAIRPTPPHDNRT